MTILFWLRKNATNRKGECPVWCSISMHQGKSEFSCRVNANPSEWNQVRQRAECRPGRNGAQADYINAHLEQITSKLLRAKIQLQAQDKPVTPLAIRQMYQNEGKAEPCPTFLEMYDKCLSRKTHLTQSSKTKYSYLRTATEQFLAGQNALAIKPVQMTGNLLEEFEFFMRQTRGVRSQNYLYKCVDGLREVLRFCHRKQVEVNHAAMNYAIKKGKVKPPVYLSSGQFAALEAFTHPNACLVRARDLAAFQRYTGLAYVDLMGFDFAKDTVFENGKTWICKARHKSDETTLLPLFAPAKAILEKYAYKLPHLSNQKYNDYLGTIGQTIGVPFKISSHVMRKTAGMLWLQAGVPYALVSKMLGHSNIATTQRHYVRVDLRTMETFFNTAPQGGKPMP